MQSNCRAISHRHAIVEDQLLGRGATGNVYLGYQLHPPHHKMAVKVIDLKKIDNPVTKYLLGCQITALTELSKIELPGHQNVVKLYEIVPHGTFIYIVTQLLQGGTLADYIKCHPNGLSEQQSLHLLCQMLQGYLHITSKNIIHRDLKPDNILFKVRGCTSKGLAIIDFGYCEMEEVANKPEVYYNVGSPKYMAPEAYAENCYSQKSDMWALGVILYQMLVGRTCDQGHTMQSYLEMIKTKGVPLPQNLSPFVKQFLSWMLNYSPKHRYTCLHALRAVKEYLKTKSISQKPLESEIRQQQIQVIPLKANPVFQSAMISQGGAQMPIQNMFCSQFLPNQINISVIQKQEPKDELNNNKKLNKSRSSNVMHLVTFQPAKQEISSPLKKVENVERNFQQRVPQNIGRQQYNAPMPQQLSRKTVEVRGPSPCKINFKFVNQPGHLHANSQPISSSPYHQTHNVNMQHQRQARVITQPPIQRADENAIRIHIKNKKGGHFQESAKKVQFVPQNKLIGGFTKQESPRIAQSPLSRIPMANHFLCRQEIKNIYPMRHISLPRVMNQ